MIDFSPYSLFINYLLPVGLRFMVTDRAPHWLVCQSRSFGRSAELVEAVGGAD